MPTGNSDVYFAEDFALRVSGTPSAVLFDVDGTLVNTLPDIASAINAALVELRLRPLAVERIGVFIGKGQQSFVLNK